MAVCDLFAQLGVRGITVLVGSGVHGVGAGNCVRFIPDFPIRSVIPSTTQARVRVAHQTVMVSQVSASLPPAPL
jgi:hypothetical protein